MAILIRRAAVAGTWYPGTAPALAAAVDGHIASADVRPGIDDLDDLVALIAPHAGLMYSGPVAAHCYRLLRPRSIELAVLVGPSHFVAFDGVSIYDGDGFDTPLGLVPTDRGCADALLAASRLIRVDAAAAHGREHSLEMQLPFLRRLAPEAKIVPLLMGTQSADTARELGDVLGRVLRGRRALVIASSDLSHYHDAAAAARLDAVVIDHLARFDAEGLQRTLEARPDHACGGGPMVSVMYAAWHLGARDAVVLNYADSGDVSGDKSSVVGYVAAALGTIRRDGVKGLKADGPMVPV
jgi:AmmeMemoRadiSam system protein B